MEPIDEERKCLRTEIKEKNLTKIKIYGKKEANIKRFIILIGKHDGWNQHRNAVMFAIRNESYGCAEAILEILKEKEQKEKEIKATLKSLYKDIAQFATQENAEGDTEIVCATKSGQHILAKILLESLEGEQRHDVIKQKERCKGDCSGNPHGEGCKAGYNLLMLALETSPDDDLLSSFIVDFVCKHKDLEYKKEIAMGKRKPEIYGPTSNSIRLAVTNGRTALAIELLKKCVSSEECYRAFLEVGPPENPQISAMASVLEANGKRSLADIESLRDAKEKNALLETLKNSPEMRNNFLHQKMTPDAIKYFREKGLSENSYLIPKPSELSHPMGLIFYNTFSDSESCLLKAKTEADCMETALESLGWGSEATTTFSNWTFPELIRLLKGSINRVHVHDHCSLFLLYITSHGFADHISGMPDKSKKKTKKKKKVKKSLSFGKIKDIIDVITNNGLPKFIPKVLIFDVCRGQLDTPPIDVVPETYEAVKSNNILVLYATLWGDVAEEDLYTPELAKQIKKWADCKISLQEIQMRVAARFKKKRFGYWDGKRPFQSPDMKDEAGGIFLRRYDDYENHCTKKGCRKDIKICYRTCLICNECLRWYHHDCANCLEDELDSFRTSIDMYKPWTCLKCNELGMDRQRL